MDISIVIVSYNVRYFLEQCILSIHATTGNLQIEIIVVDNNSIDDTCTILKVKYPQVKWIQNQKNLGFSKANNQGVEIAIGTYVLILNPDTVLPEDTLRKVFQFVTQKNDLGILGVKLIDGSGHYLPESKRNIPTPLIAFKKYFGITKKQKNEYYATHLDENESGNVDVLVGAFMFLKRSIYNEVKGFDPDYFMYGEDIDLSYKIVKKGYQNFYLSDVQVIHYKGESTQKNFQNLSHFYNAMKTFYEKHFQSNVMYDFFIKIGLKCWFVLVYFKSKIGLEKTKKTENILAVGAEGELLVYLKNNYKSTLFEEFISIEKIVKLIENKNIDCVVFDNSTLSNSKIITALQNLKQTNISFKIRPKGTRFLVESTSSKQKGEIVMF